MELLIYNIDNLTSTQYDEIYNLLYNEKKQRINLLKSDNDKKLSIAGDILLIEALKKTYNIDYKDVEFKVNSYGKPYITNKENINFNISHSCKYTICGISNYQIGVDIEKIKKFSEKTLYKCFTSKEIAYVLSSSENQERRFFTLWTLKETYVKMLGLNLQNLRDIEIIITSDNTYSFKEPNISLQIFNILDGYIIAVCENKQ